MSSGGLITIDDSSDGEPTDAEDEENKVLNGSREENGGEQVEKDGAEWRTEEILGGDTQVLEGFGSPQGATGWLEENAEDSTGEDEDYSENENGDGSEESGPDEAQSEQVYTVVFPGQFCCIWHTVVKPPCRARGRENGEAMVDGKSEKSRMILSWPKRQ